MHYKNKLQCSSNTLILIVYFKKLFLKKKSRLFVFIPNNIIYDNNFQHKLYDLVHCSNNYTITATFPLNTRTNSTVRTKTKSPFKFARLNVKFKL